MHTAVAILAITTGIFLIATVVLGVLYARERAAGDQNRAGKVKIKNGVLSRFASPTGAAAIPAA